MNLNPSRRVGISTWAPLLILAVVLMPKLGLACPQPGEFSETTPENCRLVEVGMRANLEGRYSAAEAVWAELRLLAPGDPSAALGEIETAWWRLILNEGAVQNDVTILRAAEEAIRLADERLAREPRDARALYQKGSALLHRARLNGIRRHYIKAGREGEKGRALIEQSVEIDPKEKDRLYSLGLYAYYTDAVPELLKWIDWLWFIPKGDRDQGLHYLKEVHRAGGLHATDAAFILMNIHTYHGPTDLPAALETGRDLHARFPDNVLFHSELVEVLLKIGFYDEAIKEARSLEQKKPSEAEASVRPLLARILRAQALLLSGETEEAWTLLEAIDGETAPLPVWGGAWLHLVRGQVWDTRGERGAAIEEYERVLGLEGARYNPRAGLIAQAALEEPFVPERYRELPMVGAGPP
jgi:tetratricopeptide (TPR) repeat protein